MTIRDIGIDVRAPKREPAADDQLNPFNGSLPVRGSVIVGVVINNKMQGTVIVEKEHQRKVPKYERLEKRTRRYPAHLPSNIDVQIGDEVTIAECRPISKTVKFVVVENRAIESTRTATLAKVAPKAAKPVVKAAPKVVAKPKAEATPKAAEKAAPKAATKAKAAPKAKAAAKPKAAAKAKAEAKPKKGGA